LLAGLIEKYADVVLGKIEKIRCDYIVAKKVVANLIEVTPRPDVKKVMKAFAKFTKHRHDNGTKCGQSQDKAA
jgi:hypothetical protein